MQKRLNYYYQSYIFQSNLEYPVMVSLDGKEVPTIHYTMHDKEEPSGQTEDIDVYEPTLMEEKDTSGICKLEKYFVISKKITLKKSIKFLFAIRSFFPKQCHNFSLS